ncbi:DNA polymerase III subunit delta [candidate division Kazan bacterium RBG_13_50_9]|uniref:DNA polymerase III subunit delta n=1 Tax=candidate division Kazan bacterium RBG_13_50_9 TaxID=1798535 RepID=A0A1F4NRZ6_UNCK3|nr:MAG: DNA polymerase III subunit delta [candidate division Kazan bacterium RBG_13_50_9]
MIYFLFGSDSFRLRERVRQLRSEASKLTPLDYVELAADHINFEDFINAVASQSLLAEQRLVVINDLCAAESEQLKERVTDWLAGASNDSGAIVVFCENDEPDRRTKLFKLLSRFTAESYQPLNLRQASQWLDDRAHQRSAKLSPAATRALLGDFSDDMWRLSQEVEKLALFAEGKTIDLAMVEQLVPRRLGDKIFQTIDALASGDLRLTNQLLNHQLAFGMTEQQLLVMIAYQFRNIALIKALLAEGVVPAKLAAASQLHPYVVKKTTAFAKGFSTQKIGRVFSLLHRVDTAIKSGKTPPEAGLDILAAQLVRA